MRVSPRVRALVLALTLAGTLVAAFVPDDPPAANAAQSTVVAPTARRQRSAPLADVPDIVIRRPTSSAPVADPLSPNAWLPPPAPSAKPEPPPPPMAPPFPYAYLGRVDDAGKASILMGRGDKSVTAQTGDLIDGVWRVDKIAAHHIEVTYQPLGQRQTLSAGSE